MTPQPARVGLRSSPLCSVRYLIRRFTQITPIKTPKSICEICVNL
jgi:hypothetical protein